MRTKKGVESIIAVVLILMITIASASSFFFWYNRVQKSAQGRTEHSTATFLNQLVSCVKLPQVEYNLLTNESEIQIQNCGTTSIKIGDGDDNVLITSEPCAFEINSVNCDICPLIIGPGAFNKFLLRFNNITCSGTNRTAADAMVEEGNIQHEMTISFDRTTTTASKSFVPGKILDCGLSIEAPGVLGTEFPSAPPPPQVICLDYNMTLSSNIAQTIKISGTFVPSVPVVCTVNYYDGNGCLGDAITQKYMTPDTTASFSAQIVWNAKPICYLITTIQSTDLATCKDTTTTNLTWVEPP